MTNTVLLKDTVKASGLKKVYIADRLNLTYQGYLKKENGETEFTASEIQEMQKIFSLSNKGVHDIFLSE